MKSTLALLFFSLSSIALTTQAQQLNSYFSIFGGASKPLGNFGSNDYTNNSAGFAKANVVYGLKAVDYVYKNLGIAATLVIQDNSRPNTSDLQNLSNGYNADFNAYSTTVNVTERYQNIDFLLGPQYSFVVPKYSLTIDFGASAGVMKNFTTPNTEVDVSSYTINTSTLQTTTFYQNTTNSFAFAYGANLNFRFNLSDGFGLSLSENYFASPGIKISTENDTYANGRIVSSQPVSLLQTTLGIFFVFRNKQ